MRERLYSLLNTTVKERITPACAGKTVLPEHQRFVNGDHPRVCGKDFLDDGLTDWHIGSPPRVRERHGMYLAISIYGGITPACAGKTHQVSFGNISCEDHPRVCGKDVIKNPPMFNHPGSPPRVRERLGHASALCVTRGITPACAGKTLFQPLSVGTWGDHPRVCGKDLNVRLKLGRPSGSPPRVRERRHIAILADAFSRITPACAGKTCSTLVSGFPSRDHPRVCGKDMSDTPGVTIPGGSPPRVRERRLDAVEKARRLRITPACAGKTQTVHVLSQKYPDHPRVCGKDG